MASTSAPSSPWPSSYRAPLAVITNDDHRGWTIICCALGIVIILLTLLVRVYIRVKVSPPFGADDQVLVAGTVLAIIQSGLVFAQTHEGYGSSLRLISDSRLPTMERLGWVTDLFYIWTLYASKISVVLLFRRIASGVFQKNASRIALSVTAALGVISTFLVTLRCNLSQPWMVANRSCSSLPAQWRAVAALDIITELGLFAMAIELVWGLQTPIARKGRVVFAFGLRLPTVLIAAFHIAYIQRQLSSEDPTLLGALPLILRQTELYYALMASTVPCLRPFLAGFVTNYGAMGTDTVIHGSQIGHSSRDKSGSAFGMSSMQYSSNNGAKVSMPKGKDKAPRMQGQAGYDGPSRGDHVRHNASISHQIERESRGADASSVASDESTKMIIKKEVQWRVTDEGRASNVLDDV